jgi:ATP-dependent exoDNAse (exonuclease V) beta subunit
LKNNPGFSELLTRTQSLTHLEIPFFWRMDESRCLEGIVDLALFDREAGKWLILDWKTNRIAPDEIETLRAQYQPQVAAYWKAITEMTGAAAEAAIYSTATGKLVKYETNELEDEWERLSNRVRRG